MAEFRTIYALRAADLCSALLLTTLFGQLLKHMPLKTTVEKGHLLCIEDPFKRGLVTNGMQAELLTSARERQKVLPPEATRPRLAKDWVWSRLQVAFCCAFLQRMCPVQRN